MTPQWLKENRERVLVLDARDAAEYGASHIPNAVSLPRQATYDSAEGGTGMLAPLSKIQELLGAAGVAMDVPLVVYDDEDFRDAARLFWVLEVHGHRQVAVLNGGFKLWRKQMGVVETTPVIPKATRFIANLEPKRLASKSSVVRCMGRTDTLIVDSRSHPEYTGEKTKFQRGGHVPSARNLDFESLLQREAGTCELHSVAELMQIYEHLPLAAFYVTYCNTGTRAAGGYLALRLLGREVAVYDGSFREWAADVRLPVTTGPEPSDSPPSKTIAPPLPPTPQPGR